jgi:hypothetical protein
LIWNDHLSIVSDICQQAAVQALDYIESCDNLAVSRPLVAGPSFIKWLPPDQLNFKLNLACAMGLENSQLGLRVLIRDSMGFVGAARCSRMHGVGHGLAAYANAVLNVVEFAFAVGFRRLEVDVGHKELLGLITKTTTAPCFSSIGVIVDDISEWVQRF